MDGRRHNPNRALIRACRPTPPLRALSKCLVFELRLCVSYFPNLSYGQLSFVGFTIFKSRRSRNISAIRKEYMLKMFRDPRGYFCYIVLPSERYPQPLFPTLIRTTYVTNRAPK